MPKILLCHNYYRQRGGEDNSFEDEAALLRDRGHDVSTFTVHNDELAAIGALRAAAKTVWNASVYRLLRERIRRERFDVVHFTNTFPLISPAAYYAARAEGAAVIQSLRNYRLLCPNGYFLRAGRICEDCAGRPVPWPAVRHACYRGDRAASAVTASMLGVHNALGTWRRAVDLYYAPSNFTRRKFIEAGFPEDRILTIPNAVEPDPGVGAGQGGYAVFVGRLSPEKDLETLFAAWARAGAGLQLKLVGDGPLAGRAKAAEAGGRIQWMGYRSREEVLSIVGAAAFLIMPSAWYETFGRVIVEAFSKGTPVIVSNIGAMAELVSDGRTGLHFETGNAADLAAKIQRLASAPDERARMRAAARAEYERRYRADRKHALLMDMYARAAAMRGRAKKRLEHVA